jgi:ABC-type glycerol-3-phosphate transport system substrate-binding protein
MRRFLFCIFPAIALIFFPSCLPGGNRAAILWTDRPEFALYAEYFNAAQEQYKVEVKYFEFPAQELANSAIRPDLVAGSWLKNASTRAFFKPLDGYFSPKSSWKSAFYSRLLAMGNIDGKQYLLPVSFNAPVMIFTREKAELLSNLFTINFEEIRKLSKEFNRESNGVYTRMGFSPAWDDNFLFITASLFNAGFREATPLAWDAAALERAMSYVYDWTHEINSNIRAEEDFTFKYFFDPPAKLVLSGRILFTCVNSRDFFTLAEDRRGGLDFRWIAERNTIPLTEGVVLMGMVKKGKATKAAAAFVHWFFQADTQRQILERARGFRMLESSFGIGGGFSALHRVTEQVFPQFYPDLLGHMPPEEFLSPANMLPRNWTALKEQAILPYLNERSRNTSRNAVNSLERRVADWFRLNK